MFSTITLVAVTALVELSRAQNVITYPGWRGDNLMQNGSAPQNDPGTLGIDYANGSAYPTFPFGQQFMFPCGGMPVSSNRTGWPIKGGAISVQPGLFSGHEYSQFYFNLGVFDDGALAATNYSNNMLGPVEVTGPNNSVYAGQFCFPQVPMPSNLPTLAVGTNVTIQVVQVTASGAALYNCFDAEIVDPAKNPTNLQQVNSQNCYNSSDITISQVFSTSSCSTSSSGALPAIAIPSKWVSALLVFGAAAGLFAL